MKLNNNMKQYVTLMLGFMITLILMQSASALLGTYQEETDVDLIQTCNNCTYCNLTSIKYPNGTNILTNIEMIQDGTYFNYLLDGGNTSTVGTYTYYYDCGNAAEIVTGGIDFEVTITGDETPEGSSYILGAIFLIVFGIGWFFLFLSVQMDEPGPKIFFLLSSFVFLLGSLAFALVVGFDSNFTESINTTIRVLMFAFGLIFFVVFAYIMIKQTVLVLDLMREKKGYEVGW